MMWQDPVVREVREAGDNLAKQSDYNLHTFFENLRKNERKLGCQVISRINQLDTSEPKRKTG